MTTTNEDLRDIAIRHAIFIEQYKAGEVRRLIKLLDKVDRDILRKLKNRGVGELTLGQKRLISLIKQIRDANSELYTEVGRDYRRSLKRFAAQEAEFAASTLSETMPVDLSVKMPSPVLINAIVTEKPFQGRLLKNWVKDLERSKTQALEDAINIGLVEGESTDQIIRRIRGTKAANYRDGVLEVGRRHAASIVRTSVNHVSNSARNAVYEANDDVINGVQWVSTLDGRTTAVCRGRDGKVFPLKGDSPRPPAHIGCRSTIVAVTKSWQELGIDAEDAPPPMRAALDGEVAGTETYNTWLRKQPRDFIEDVLGVEKAQLYISGKLPLDKFINASGRELTLSELKNKYPSAFVTVSKPAKPTATKQRAAKLLPGGKVLSQAPNYGLDEIDSALRSIDGVQYEKLQKFIDKNNISALLLTSKQLGKRKLADTAFYRKIGETIGVDNPYLAFQLARTARPKGVNGFTFHRYNHVIVKIEETYAEVDKNELARIPGLIGEALKSGNKQWSFSNQLKESGLSDEAQRLVTLIHELGHQVHFKAGSPSSQLVKETTKYSGSNKWERYAEAFTAWFFNRAALEDFSSDMASELDRLIKVATGE